MTSEKNVSTECLFVPQTDDIFNNLAPLVFCVFETKEKIKKKYSVSVFSFSMLKFEGERILMKVDKNLICE